MRHGRISVVLVVLSWALVAQAQTAPTFTRDVAPIFYSKCVDCHRPAMFAPMSLIGFDEARPWAQAIRRQVAARSMPPWGADPAHGVFRNDPRLSDNEIATIVAWVDAGAPKGDDQELPVAPTFADGWSIGQPDEVFTVKEPFQIPAAGKVDYQYRRIPIGLTEDKWIQAIEIKPEARAHVHHVVAYTRPASRGMAATSASAVGPTVLEIAMPNQLGKVYEHGSARLLPAKSDIILQIHYTTNGEAAADRVRIGLVYAKQPPKMQLVGGGVVNASFRIPAGAAAHTVTASWVLRKDTTITSLMPHMHVRGKDMTYTAKFRDGTTEVLLSVPKFDFNWQITYELATPRTFPKGTKIEVVAHFDNSPANKFNPDPTKAVRWGDQTWQEMMIGFFTALVERPSTPSSRQK